MSFQTWIKEFYPIDAEEIANQNEVTDEELILHSLKKWKGALPENTEKHNVTYKNHMIESQSVEDQFYGAIVFATGTCSLCQKYDGESCGTSYRSKSDDCPIIRMRGIPCDRLYEKTENAYSDSESNPKPMIKLLEETLNFVRNGG